MLHIRDLLVSRQKWLLYPTINISTYILIPVIVAGGETTLVDYMQDQYAAEIEIREAETSQFSFDNRLDT